MMNLLERMHPRSCLSSLGGPSACGIIIGDGSSDNGSGAHEALHRTAIRLIDDIGLDGGGTNGGSGSSSSGSNVGGDTNASSTPCMCAIDSSSPALEEEEENEEYSATAAAAAARSHYDGAGSAAVANNYSTTTAAATIASSSRGAGERKSSVLKRRLNAGRKLFKLSIPRENRIPLICTSSLDVLPTLIACISPLEATAGTTGAYSTSAQSGKTKREQQLHQDEVDIRRLACLTLNNLSVPDPNKAVMALGRHSTALLTALLRNVESAAPESHLCVICLYNLSFLDDAADVLIGFGLGLGGGLDADASAAAAAASSSPHHYSIGCDFLNTSLSSSDPNDVSGSTIATASSTVSSTGARRSPIRHRRGARQQHRSPSSSPSPSPTATTRKVYHHHRQQHQHCYGPPLDNNRSLLRILEAMIRTYSPFLLSPVLSVEGEAIRWAVGLMSNLVSVERRADIVLHTDIPFYIVQNLRSTPRTNINEWTEESMEEMSLIFLCNLIKFEGGREMLKTLEVNAAIEPVLGKGGIHAYRAGLIHCALAEEGNDGDDDYKMTQSYAADGEYPPLVQRSDTMGEF